MRNKVRELQRDLYRAAKTNPERCFHSLYDKAYRSDVLWEAWERVKANGGVAGNDGESIEGIIDRGEMEYLKEEGKKRPIWHQPRDPGSGYGRR
jgi:RNA-directed DNA polymerase